MNRRSSDCQPYAFTTRPIYPLTSILYIISTHLHSLFSTLLPGSKAPSPLLSPLSSFLHLSLFYPSPLLFAHQAPFFPSNPSSASSIPPLVRSPSFTTAPPRALSTFTHSHHTSHTYAPPHARTHMRTDTQTQTHRHTSFIYHSTRSCVEAPS